MDIVCDFVLIRLTDFELEAKTQILDQISSQIWPLAPTSRGPFLENLKKRIYKIVCRVKSLDCANFPP